MLYRVHKEYLYISDIFFNILKENNNKGESLENNPNTSPLLHEQISMFNEHEHLNRL